MQLEGIDHVAVGVRDVERSAKWYIEVLGFERLYEDAWGGVPTFVGKNRENFLAAQRELKKRGIKFEFQDHEISQSVNFLDPDGHQLEITTYELEKRA